MTDISPTAIGRSKEGLLRATQWLFKTHGSLLDTISNQANNYNIIRVVLAASVIWFHSAAIAGSQRPDWISLQLRPITDLGGLAVQCFFFLSGLFVAQSIYKDHNLLDFSIKRFMRIFPGLFVCLVLTTIMLSLATHGWFFWRALALPETYEYILGNGALDLKWSIPTLIPDNPSTTINGSIHTLSTEVKMYAVLGLLGLLGIASSKYRIALTASLIVIAMAIIGPRITALLLAPTSAYAMIMMFVTGMLAFSVAKTIRVNVAQGLVLVGLLLLTRRMPPLHTIAFYITTIWAMLFFGQLSPVRRWLRPKVDPSYGIYIYGWPCEQLIKSLMPSAGIAGITLMAIALAYAFGRFSWKYVEKPCMDMAKAICNSRDSLRQVIAPFSINCRWGRSFYAVLAMVLVCAAMQRVTNRYDLLPVHTMISKIVDFGPHEASAKAGFSVQPDGSSALWVRTDVAVPRDTAVVFKGRRLQTMVDAAGLTLTAEVSGELIRKPGDKQIYLRSVAPDGILESNTVILKINQ
jgi:peptidoglycan/LPS O-acetylase OafA/YrhL